MSPTIKGVSGTMGAHFQIPLWRKNHFRRSDTPEQNEPRENPVGIMFFHAYCIGAIEKYCADHGKHSRLDPEEDD